MVAGRETEARLIVLCGLPGSGKTTRAKRLEVEMGGVRLCPDEWLPALGTDLWDHAARARVEALQWTLAQRLLELGGTVIIEWGVWAREERDTLRLGARARGRASSCTTSTCRWTNCGDGCSSATRAVT